MKTASATLRGRFPFESRTFGSGAASIIFTFSLLDHFRVRGMRRIKRERQKRIKQNEFVKSWRAWSLMTIRSRWIAYLSNGFLGLFALGFQLGRLLIGESPWFVDEHLVLHFFVVSGAQVAMLLGFGLSWTPFGQHTSRLVHTGFDCFANSMLRLDRDFQWFNQVFWQSHREWSNSIERYKRLATVSDEEIVFFFSYQMVDVVSLLKSH